MFRVEQSARTFSLSAEYFKMPNTELWSVLLTEYCAGGKIEKNEMGGACGAKGGEGVA